MITDEEKNIIIKGIKDLLDVMEKSTILFADINLENQITEIPHPLIPFVRYVPTGIRDIMIKVKLMVNPRND